MTWYVSRRLLGGLITLAVVVLLTFFLVRLAPGSPVSYLGGLSASAEQLAALEERLGLNLPLMEQLGIYLTGLAGGDLGFSLIWNRPVMEVILSRLPATLLLMVTSFGISLVGGIFLGVVASRIPYGRTDNVVMVGSLAAFSMPQFWVGMILILIFGLALGWLPVQGMVSVGRDLTGFDALTDVISHLILPATALGLTELAIFVRITRASMLEVIEADFIRTARSKGIAERRVLLHHALRNAMLPLITIAAIRLRNLFAGAILVEAIFGWPGIGTLTLNAMLSRDYPMILGITIWAAVITVLVNLLADLAYPIVDRRIVAQ